MRYPPRNVYCETPRSKGGPCILGQLHSPHEALSRGSDRSGSSGSVAAWATTMVGDVSSPNGSQPTVRKALVRRRHDHPLRALVFAIQTQSPDLAQIMGGLGICVAPCTILRWVSDIPSDLPKPGSLTSAPWAGHGAATKPISRLAGNGFICTARWMQAARRSSRI